MAAHRGDWVTPFTVPYRDVVVYQLPPPTQGLAAAAMIVRLRTMRPAELEPGSGFVGSFKMVRDASYALRDRYISDPEFSPVPFDPFLEPGQVAVGEETGRDGGDTVYLCAADEHGNIVSLIQSVAFDFGSGIVAEGTGMLLQNRGTYFSLDAGHVNRLEPKKRTMHTLIPAMATRNGMPWAAFGSMGGDGQPQLQTQVLINLVDHGLEPAEAVARPRIRVVPGGGTVNIEADYPGAGELARSDPKIRLMPPKHHSFGHAHAIVLDGPSAWRGGADPRSDGSVESV
jgi:gamma-glutamyltranspeptidase/glutathione hydrolase